MCTTQFEKPNLNSLILLNSECTLVVIFFLPANRFLNCLHNVFWQFTNSSLFWIQIFQCVIHHSVHVSCCNHQIVNQIVVFLDDPGLHLCKSGKRLENTMCSLGLEPFEVQANQNLKHISCNNDITVFLLTDKSVSR